MTSIGVKPFERERVLPQDISSYRYTYPSVQRFQITQVKEGIYHPRLPHFAEWKWIRNVENSRTRRIVFEPNVHWVS